MFLPPLTESPPPSGRTARRRIGQSGGRRRPGPRRRTRRPQLPRARHAGRLRVLRSSSCCRLRAGSATLLAGPSVGKSVTRGQGKFDGLRRLYLFGGIQEFDGNESSGFVVIENDTGSRLVAFSHLARVEDDRQRIGFFIVDDF